MECRSVVLSALVVFTILTQKAQGECPAQTFTTTGNFSLPKTATAGDSCLFTITRSAATKFTTLMLQHVAMATTTNDTLTVYDGKVDPANVVMTFKAGDLEVVSQTVITFSETTTIQFDVTVDNTTSVGHFDFNLEECKQTLTDSWVLPVASPIYLPNKEDFTCEYTVVNSLPADRMAVVSFSAYNLKDNSYLALKSGKDSINMTKPKIGLPEDFFDDQQANETVITFKFAKNAELQNFSMTFDITVKSCTRDIALADKTVVELKLPTHPGPEFMCRLRASVNTGVVSAYLQDLSLASQRDSVTVLEGANTNGKVLSMVTDSNKGHIALSSAKALSVSIILSSVKAPRNLKIVFTRRDHGARLEGEGKLKLTPLPKAVGFWEKTYWQLVAKPGNVVSVTLKTNLTNGSSMAFLDGLDLTSKVLANLTGKNQGLRTVVGGASMMVDLTNFPENGTLEADFSSVVEGCDKLETGLMGQLVYKESNVTATQTCQWSLAPQLANGTIVLHFDTLRLGAGDLVHVYSGLSDKDPLNKLVAAFTNTPETTTPLPEITVQKSARIVIKRAAAYHADMLVTLHFSVSNRGCGGVLSADTGVLSTPNFPNQYPLNADCVWSKTSAKPKLLLLSVQSLNLASNHMLCVMNTTKKTDGTLVAFGGSSSELPPDFIAPADNMTQIHFSSVPTSKPADKGKDLTNTKVGMGAQVKYWYLDCGGNMSMASGSFSSPGYPNKPTANATCVWIIKIKGNSSKYIVDFNITTSGSGAKNIAKYLKVYDGMSMRSTVMPEAVYNKNQHALSRYNTLVVTYFYDVQGKDNVGFNLSFTTHTCNMTCANGICMHSDWMCNGFDDCGDSSDEKNCGHGPAPAKQDHSGYVKSSWVVFTLFVGIALGAALLFLVPRILKRVRANGPYSRMNDNIPVVA